MSEDICKTRNRYERDSWALQSALDRTQKGTILPAKTEIPFPLPLPPQVVPWKTTRVNKNQRAQTNPRAEKTGLSNLQPREGKTGITNLSKQITNFWRPPVTTYPTARQKAETADPKTSWRLSTGYRPKRSLLKALAPEWWRKASLTRKCLRKKQRIDVRHH